MPVPIFTIQEALGIIKAEQARHLRIATALAVVIKHISDDNGKVSEIPDDIRAVAERVAAMGGIPHGSTMEVKASFVADMQLLAAYIIKEE